MLGGHGDKGGVPLKSAGLSGSTIGGAKRNEASVPESEEGELGFVFPPVVQAKSDGIWNALSLSPRGHRASPR